VSCGNSQAVYNAIAKCMATWFMRQIHADYYHAVMQSRHAHY
jgi:hypothetical protein